MFWLNFYQIAYIAKLIFFLLLCYLLFPVALKQNLRLSQESLLIFYIPTGTMIKKNESIFELTCKCNVYYFHHNRLPYGNRFLYFQLEVEYYFNKTNKNK